MPVGYGDNPPVGPGAPGTKPGGAPLGEGKGPNQGDAPAEGLPPAGPHDDRALTNPDATLGTGALPPAGSHDDVDSTSS